MENIQKHDDSSLVVEDMQVQRTVISIEEIYRQIESWEKSKENAEAQLDYWKSLLSKAEEFELKTKAELINIENESAPVASE